MAVESSEGERLDPITRLDHENIYVTCGNEDGTVRNITNDRLVFEARFRYTDEEPLIVKDSNNGPNEIEKTNPTIGEAVIHLVPEDTTEVPRSTNLRCQLEITNSEEKTSTTMFEIPIKYRV